MDKITSIEYSDVSIVEIQNNKSPNQSLEKIHETEVSTGLLDKGLEFIALGCLIISVSLAIFGVIVRYFFGVSFGIIEEICRYSIIYGVFAYIGPLIKKNEHIKMDLMENILKGKALLVNDLIISIILSFSYAFLCWTGIQWVISLYQLGIMTSSGLMLMVIPAFAIPFGMFFGWVYSLQQIFIDINKIRRLKS
ncbi:TRAP transporter small permease [Neobacillus vireti]|uniref:TRAP transporter small permease n=1 Tax=Neobacillus vireti TaxID=220686 RepID=UPI0030007FE3